MSHWPTSWIDNVLIFSAGVVLGMFLAYRIESYVSEYYKKHIEGSN